MVTKKKKGKKKISKRAARRLAKLATYPHDNATMDDLPEGDLTALSSKCVTIKIKL